MTSCEWIALSFCGLCLGSFLNVLIERTKNNEGLFYPFSKCPKCNHRLFWWHNIPLVSYFILKGKCFFCNKAISIKYPIIEVSGAFIVLFSFRRYISIIDALSVTIIISILCAISLIDLDIKKIDIRLVAALFCGGLLLNRYDIPTACLNALIAAGIISALIIFSERIFKKSVFGLGDVFLVGGCAAVIDSNQLFLFLCMTILIQFLFVFPTYILNLIKSKQTETLKYLIIFFVTCLIFYVSKNIYFWGSTLVLIGFLTIMCISACKIIINLFNNIKSDKTDVYCPFAPAIASACIILLFL